MQKAGAEHMLSTCEALSSIPTELNLLCPAQLGSRFLNLHCEAVKYPGDTDLGTGSSATEDGPYKKDYVAVWEEHT